MSSDTKKSVLVTGANGFVGARLCRQFLGRGFTVYAGVRQSANLSALQALKVEFRYGDITDPKSLPEMVRDVDFVIHNAGLVKAKETRFFYDVNETGTKNLFDAVKQHNPNVRRVVLISSMAAAGPSLPDTPRNETDPPQPITEYGRSKLAGEKAALAFKDDLPITILRPSGVYGPGDKEVLSFFQTLHSRIKPYIGDCSRKLQLIHVDDLCRAAFRATESNVTSGATYFIAEPKAYSMKELILTLRKVIGRAAFPLYLPAPVFKLIAFCSESIFKLFGATAMLTREKAGELLASWEVDISRARTELSFEAEKDFETGARETFAWYKKEGWL